MRRAPILALALVLPAAAFVAGSANASPPAPALSSNASMGSMDMSKMDMSKMGTSHSSAHMVSRNAARVAAGKIPIIKGSVGPGFDISVTPTGVTAGRYKFVIQDKSAMHNWHILGTGVDKGTTIAGTGKTVWKLKLVKGSYEVHCDAHSLSMVTHLNVT